MQARKPVTKPTESALASWLCALWGRHVGARGGGRLLPGCGASGPGRCPTPDRSSLGACGRGPLPTGCGCGGCGRGDLSPTPQRALLRAGFACCGGGTRAPGGGASCLGLGRPGLGALPSPTARPLGRAPAAHYPLAVGAGGVGVVTRHQPTACALASWLCALWGRHKGARGERLLPECVASRVGRSPTPDRSSFWACCRGPLLTSCGCGGCGRGDPSSTPQRALLRAGCACCGGGTRAPGGGATCLGVGRPGSGALPSPAARPLGRAARTHYPLAVVAEGAGVGTRHQPHSARSCELALRAVGAARGRPGGAPLANVWGVRGRALSQLRPLVLWGMLPGPTTHWLWVRGMRAWGPVTKPTARALASWLCVLWGRHVGARGGHLLPGRGASRVGRSPTPDRSSFGACGRGRLPTGCGCGECGCGDCHQTHSARSCVLAVRAVGAARGRPGGAPLAWVWGVRGRALSHPRPLVLWGVRQGRTTYWLWVRGGAGVGTRHQPHRARSCELALCAVGAARGRPGGASLAWVWGVRGRALSQPRLLVLLGVRPGPAPHWLWVRRAGVGARLSLAPPAVPWFVVCCALFPGLRHPVAVVA